MKNFKSLTAGLYLGIAAVGMSAGPAQAVLIDWTLSATFNDGDTLNGGFTYDTVAMSFSNTAMTSTGGILPGRNFSQQFSFNNPFFFGLLDPADGPDFTNDPSFHLIVTTDFSDLATTVAVLQMARCSSADCNFRVTVNTFNQATLSGRVADIPEPGTLAILGLGLAGLGVARRKKAA